ncbi:MAG: hypothetical protein KF832_13155 [Caldilineaceae bacterium]|nr:hypothetical protein [Caldilineaceae bacterium]
MTLQEFTASVQQSTMPTGLSLALQALWQAGTGDWHAAHAITQAEGDADVDWVHAYLHREEGDLSNAGYWYRRAGKPVATQSLADEWQAIATTLLAKE